jgi:Tol biopolymer transport system component
MEHLWTAMAAVATLLGLAGPPHSPASVMNGPSGRIIYNATAETGSQSDIFSVHPAGAHATQLTTGPGEKYAGSYSATAHRIAFVRGGVSGQLWTMRENGRDARPVGTGAVTGSCPRFSPDGSLIAYRAGDFGEIHVVNRDGTGARKLSGSDTEYDQCPSWSPDGKRLAFIRYTGFSSADVWTMNADGSGAVQLTHDGTVKTTAAWSPDGRSIAFDSGGDIFVMTSAGQDPRPVTRTAAQESDPVWSPRSHQIAYAYADGPAFELRITEASGRYTRTVGVSGSPAAWRP